MYKQLVLVMFFAGVVYSQTTLSGSIENLVLTKNKSPYIIEDNLTIKENNQITIEKGCVLLFKPFTGIIVDGSLIVEGTFEEPVVFTTINDNKYNKESSVFPNPFDWNGILINEKAQKVKIYNFILTYSVYGVRSMKEGLIIKNGSFRNNGQFHVTVNGTIQPVADGVPYSYGKNAGIKKNENAKTEKLPLTLAISGFVCGGVSAAAGIVLSQSRKTYLHSDELGNLNRTEKVIKVSFAGTIAFGAAAVVLLPASLVIHKKKDKEDQQRNVQILPIYKEGPGIIAQLFF
jgi:hypothetical protein